MAGVIFKDVPQNRHVIVNTTYITMAELIGSTLTVNIHKSSNSSIAITIVGVGMEALESLQRAMAS